jgi:hypothetical protein
LWDHDALRQHPFLSSIPIDEQRDLHKQRSPLVFKLVPVSLPSRDAPSPRGSTPTGTPTSPSPLRRQGSSFLSDQQYLLVDWNRFLLKHETIIFMSRVHKKRKLSTKKRQLIMTDFPRLFYVDIKTLEVKGTIPWSADIKVELKAPKAFSIKTVSLLLININVYMIAQENILF